MKQLHRPDLFTWSRYDEPLRIDFNGILWRREGGNVLVDPPPLADCDVRHLDALGGAASIILTTSDHVRGAREIAARTGAQLLGPAAERDAFPVACAGWLAEEDEPFPGLRVHALGGSKTEGELALVLEETTAIFGDAVRAHRAGALMLLPREKLRDPLRLVESLRSLRELHPRIAHVLVGDGWSAFNDGGALLDALLES
jgi:glyoxylase-like metal-dependent hydrolase (beta-lactamase superfamily II)